MADQTMEEMLSSCSSSAQKHFDEGKTMERWFPPVGLYTMQTVQQGDSFVKPFEDKKSGERHAILNSKLKILDGPDGIKDKVFEFVYATNSEWSMGPFKNNLKVLNGGTEPPKSLLESVKLYDSLANGAVIKVECSSRANKKGGDPFNDLRFVSLLGH